MDAVLWYCQQEGIEPDTVGSMITKGLKEKIEANARDLNYQKAFVDAIMTSRTTMNTQIKGQIGYKKDNILDKIDEAKKTYDEFMWIIK